MKNFKCLFIVLIVGFLFYSCEKDEINILKDDNKIKEIDRRSFNQIDCGFSRNFCSSEPTAPPVVARISSGNGGIGVQIRNDNFKLHPYQLFDGSTAVIVNTGRETYVGHNSKNEYLLSKTSEVELHEQLSSIIAIEYNEDFSTENVISKFEEITKVSNLGTSKEPIFDFTNVRGGYPISWVKECEVVLVSKVEKFVNVFLNDDDQPHIEGFIEEAFSNCPPAYIEDYQSDIPNRCLNFCIDPRCVVNELLDIDAGLSEFQKRVLVSRYLQESMGLTDEEQNWLTLNDQSDFIFEVYDGLNVEQSGGSCEINDCGLAGGYHAIIKNKIRGENINTESTLSYFSELICEDVETYTCFREAQIDEDGFKNFIGLDPNFNLVNLEYSLLLELVKYKCNSNYLVDACSGENLIAETVHDAIVGSNPSNTINGFYNSLSNNVDWIIR